MIELYKELIIDHGLNPRNKYIASNFTHHGRGYNHFCGDSFDLYLTIDGNLIKNISFNGQGCSISTASASLMTISTKNKNIDDAKNLFFYFKNILMKKTSLIDVYTDINILSIVNKFPSRVKCATLIWHTLNDIIKNK